MRRNWQSKSIASLWTASQSGAAVGMGETPGQAGRGGGVYGAGRRASGSVIRAKPWSPPSLAVRPG